MVTTAEKDVKVEFYKGRVRGKNRKIYIHTKLTFTVFFPKGTKEIVNKLLLLGKKQKKLTFHFSGLHTWIYVCMCSRKM